ncbi:hypothetical protein D3C74_453190 [compost metagenome]
MSSQDSAMSESIGLRNVVRRLALNAHPGMPARIKIDNLEAGGVKLQVKLYAGE